MTEHTQLIDAINVRTAVRRYEAEPLDDDQARQLAMTIDAVNTVARLNIQLVRNHPEAFADSNASGHTDNAKDYIAIVGPRNDAEAQERAGFYAQRLVLSATLRGLGTCWVAGSWNREEAAAHCRIGTDEQLYLGVIVGYPVNHLAHLVTPYADLVTAQQNHRPSKSLEAFTPDMGDDGRANAPQWFLDGVEAARKAPSAMNRQPATFRYHAADDTATASLDPEVPDSYALNDLGIAKLHFQIGAGQGAWAWGDGGLFVHR